MIFIACYAFAKILSLYDIDIDGLIESLGSLGKMSFSILLLVVTGIIVLISWYLAQKVIYKKEF